MEVKIQHEKRHEKNFYLPVLNELKLSTNLTKIQEKLSISKQKLNYYIRQLRKKGFIIQKGRGWYEVVKKSKNSTKYGILLKKDFCRGHAYIWNLKLPKNINGWDKRIKLLKKKGINYKLVGALKRTPRIKVLGRKVWLCNEHLRIFDKQGSSYYGETAKESKQGANLEFFRIISALENKLGFLFKPCTFSIKKEHYALIKNDLAIDQNRKGIILRISDSDGEWLLIDDSLGEGGELENIGKKAYPINKDMQKWWNDNKKHKFKVTPTLLLNSIKDTTQLVGQNAQHLNYHAENMRTHVTAVQDLSQQVQNLSHEVGRLNGVISRLEKD